MTTRNCKKQDCKDETGNCRILGSDGLPVQCVGPWVEDKYFFLEKYLNASCEARRKFADKNNAVFIDLFAGPGKCIVKNEKREIDSGGIRAFKRDEASFNEYFYFDISSVNAKALEKRINSKSNCNFRCGDSNGLINELVETLSQKPYRYHFAFIDPFGPDGLKFETLRNLAKLNRMDILLHFPIGSIKRNLGTWLRSKSTILDNFLGTDLWRKGIDGLSSDKVFKLLIDVFTEQLKSIGYPEKGLRMASSDSNIYTGLPTVSVKNTKDVDLYVLILASKHQLAQKIWNSIIKIDPKGQKELF
ncbi:MAG: three-Cys-motif partner protein TcmP [Nitrospirae bacterium]|nr:three-Cys-motif partner protein TcmP [Nitrospirota bacterium]MCL5978971.1 three-Cys-motif partner protein TcmP [Nitrospirota bacterium]